mmetsp:Transcript_1718/g.4378  ORF Transcript_1718/g.4378 Transcript_1718/m.4378 type:complete len:251 (-) Transcript_1718:410-1162(-)
MDTTTGLPFCLATSSSLRIVSEATAEPPRVSTRTTIALTFSSLTAALTASTTLAAPMSLFWPLPRTTLPAATMQATTSSPRGLPWSSATQSESFLPASSFLALAFSCSLWYLARSWRGQSLLTPSSESTSSWYRTPSTSDRSIAALAVRGLSSIAPRTLPSSMPLARAIPAMIWPKTEPMRRTVCSLCSLVKPSCMNMLAAFLYSKKAMNCGCTPSLASILFRKKASEWRPMMPTRPLGWMKILSKAVAR